VIAKNKRLDIQALRGLAVILVVLHHAELMPQLKAGYLGVDIFFVVSGFLMTGIVQRSIDEKTFSFGDFYFRRAKRLLPAAYVVFLGCAIAAPWFLTRIEYQDFIAQLLGALTFTGNIVLWTQAGYFESAAQLKPLLHVWSLAIEEQYYLFLPAALFLTPRRWWSPLAIATTAASLALCMLMVATKPGAVFYLLPTRAWEIGLGSIGALCIPNVRAQKIINALLMPGLAVLVLLPFFPIGNTHPGLNAILICLATLLVILRRYPGAGSFTLFRSLGWFGDISYSLYLVHWPLIAFASNAWVSKIPFEWRAVLAIASVLAAWGLFRWVEQPTQNAPLRPTYRNALSTLGVTVALAGAALALEARDSRDQQLDFAHIRRGNSGLSVDCEYGVEFLDLASCRIGESPKVLLWGDSYAMHLADAVGVGNKQGLIQATKSACIPTSGLAYFVDDGWANRSRAEDCIAFNRSVLEYLRVNTGVEVVVLASRYSGLLAGNKVLVEHIGEGNDVSFSETKGGVKIAAEGFQKTIAQIRDSGKRVIVVGPPPSGRFDVGRCLERRYTGRLTYGIDNDLCNISLASSAPFMRPVLELLDIIASTSDVDVIRLDESLCDEYFCRVELDGKILYVDSGHLTHEGSQKIGALLNLSSRIFNGAR